MINLKLVLCLPLILIDGANMVDFVKSSVSQGMFLLRKSDAKIQIDQIQKYDF